MGNIFGQEFERDEATKLGVLSLVNDTRATATQPLDDAVVRDCLADHGGGAGTQKGAMGKVWSFVGSADNQQGVPSLAGP